MPQALVTRIPASRRTRPTSRVGRVRPINRRRAARESHAGWSPPADRADPVALLEEQATTRVPELVPIRYARMMVSPFTFYRGAALIMAADLAGTPVSGITTQICGDAHLSNFGVFGTPERRLVFDINDFDETLPGPWEWDVKRLVAELRDRRTPSRILRRGPRRDEPHRSCAATGSGCCQAAASRVLDAWYDSSTPTSSSRSLEAERKAEADRRQAGEAHRRRDRQGAHSRQHAGRREARRSRRRPVADHSRSSAHRAVELLAPAGRAAGEDEALMQELLRVVPDDAAAAEASDARVLVRAHGAQGRRRRQRRHPRLDRAAARA